MFYKEKPPVHLWVMILILVCAIVLSCKTRVPAASASEDARSALASSQKKVDDSVVCLTQTVLYREFVAKNRWTEAIIPWRKVFVECQPKNQNFYIDGGNIFRYHIKSTTDSVKKEAYIDTLILLYDRRIALNENAGFISGRKGLDLLNYRPREKQAAYECMLLALSQEKNNTQSAVLQSLVVTAIELNQEGRLDTTGVLTTYAAVKAVIFYNLKENIRDTLLYLQANRGIDKAFQPWADCRLLSGAYKTRVNTASAEELENIIHLFELLGCFESEVFRQATDRLYQLKPGPLTAFYQGLNAYSQQDYPSALSYFKESAAQFTDPAKKAACLIGAGRTYVAMNQYEAAHEMAGNALAYDPRSGRAYLLLGDAYVGAAKSCGNGDPLAEEAVYWAAVDQYRFALQIDPSTRDEANAKIAGCIQRFPMKKLLFFHNLKVGEIYTIGCWIQEKTVIRARPE